MDILLLCMHEHVYISSCIYAEDVSGLQEAVKGKKWAYTSQHGLATPQNTYY
jgi:hypothetical protein